MKKTVLSASIRKGYRMVCKENNGNLQSHVFRLRKQVQYSACMMKYGKRGLGR